MRQFSRWMPPPERASLSLRDYISLGVSGTVVIAGFVLSPAFLGSVVICAIIAIVLALYDQRRLRLLSVQRQGEDIGTFARSFDRHSELFDPWVVRAVWEELQPYVAFRGGRMPLRPADDLDTFICIDPEDLEFDVLPTITKRARRSLENMEANPFYGRVETVEDLVMFIANQPRRSESGEVVLCIG